MKYKHSKLIFLILLISLSVLYQYHKILFLRPCSIHQWRQCDCLSITLNYFKENRAFLNPSVCWIGEKGTGETISEFPIIYYTVAQLWKIFGQHEFIFRGLVVLLLFTSLFLLFRIFERFLDNSFWAIGLVMLLFTSPIWIYYGNNFIADVPGLSLAIIGWFYFMKFYSYEKNKYLLLAMFFFLLGGLIKISSLISFASILGIFLMETIFSFKFSEQKKIFRKPSVQFIPFIIVGIVIASWYKFAVFYNELHNKDIFLTGIIPIWHLSSERISFVWSEFSQKLIYSYYYKYTLIFIGICFFFNLFHYKYSNKFLLIINAFMGLAVIIFFILWFDVFHIHDYYMINLLIFSVITLFNTAIIIKTKYNKFLNSRFAQILFLLFLALNVFYAAAQNNIKYFSPSENTIFSLVVPDETLKLWRWHHWNYKSHFKAYETIEAYNRSLGIKRNDLVVTMPDISINISLYLMDQKGFTDYYGYPGVYGKERMEKFISMGAKYLFVNDKKVYADAYIQPFIKNKIGSYENIDIFYIGDYHK